MQERAHRSPCRLVDPSGLVTELPVPTSIIILDSFYSVLRLGLSRLDSLHAGSLLFPSPMIRSMALARSLVSFGACITDRLRACSLANSRRHLISCLWPGNLTLHVSDHAPNA